MPSYQLSNEVISYAMRAKLEQHQVWIYLIAIVIGTAIGWRSPETLGAGSLDQMLR
ncbi:MAG: hypothetical protein U5L98_03150 [Halomonas sp.]|uniref:hypothetical protein n=1 Tax=Halomonas sp. TaxID=1486246 RepID=UPI002ACD97A0|nr:hypothetical protein [Halomonas sp.]MDZ7851660.1 hypothetical protein [Halomonas sp.]